MRVFLMYANFTEETCTGTGDTLTLSGLTTGNLTFSTSFADGDLVSYVVEDSGGSIKVVGVGTYNTANTITRNDSWNYNGTVVDKNPSTNIVLSAGTHTVRCDAVDGSFAKAIGISRNGTKISGHFLSEGATSTQSINANTVYYIPFLNDSGAPLSPSSIAVGVTTAGTAAARVIIGFATAYNGEPYKLLFQTSELDASTTGLKSGSVADSIPIGWSFTVLTSNENLTIDSTNRNFSSQNPILGAQYSGGAYFGRVYSSVTREFSALANPLPASTNAADLSNVFTIGVIN